MSGWYDPPAEEEPPASEWFFGCVHQEACTRAWECAKGRLVDRDVRDWGEMLSGALQCDDCSEWDGA